MKKILLLLVALFAFYPVSSAQITQDEAIKTVFYYMHRSERYSWYNTVFIKDSLQTEVRIVSNAEEVIELDYACWVFYVKYFEDGADRFLIVNANNGNLLEVSTKINEEPIGWSGWTSLESNAERDFEPSIFTRSKWKLAGIVDSISGDTLELEPKDCRDCYTLTSIDGECMLDRWISSIHELYLRNPWEIQDFRYNQYCENPDICEKYYFDGVCYEDVATYRNKLCSADSYTVTDHELKIFSENSKSRYLLFKKVDKSTEPEYLIGTSWKLLGTVDIETGNLKAYHPEEFDECFTLPASSDCYDFKDCYNYIDCDECFTISFNSNRSFTGRMIGNTAFGTYQINYTTGEFYCIVGGTLARSLCEDAFFNWRKVFHTVNSFSLREDELRLYYDDQKNYLLFKKKVR